MRIIREKTAVVCVDYQERILPAMTDPETLLQNTVKLLKGLRVLGVPVYLTQQYTKGLGDTVAPIREAAGTSEHLEKLTFSAYPQMREKLLPPEQQPYVLLCGIESHICVLQTAMDLKATAILAATKSGYTAKVISRFRPACPIVALCQNESTRRQLAISWGVHPYLSGEVDSTDRMFSLAVDVARNAVQIGDTVVITAGVPLGQSGTTNLIKAQIVEGGL